MKPIDNTEQFNAALKQREERIEQLDKQLMKVKAEAWDGQQDLLAANREQQAQIGQIMTVLQELARLTNVPVEQGKINLDKVVQAVGQAMLSSTPQADAAEVG